LSDRLRAGHPSLRTQTLGEHASGPQPPTLPCWLPLGAAPARPLTRAHYERRRQRGDTYSAAARHLANRFFGILYHCLQKRTSYDEAKAFPPDIKIAT
jgi:hypothetical protein